ncbi:hypothetical protein BSPWISOXPB_4447 [uncultured Gammaproteobacteria bacterium]|nr:hypothetical protein BSPWISOXPB_4447 [uncultured Gammaproteobacteria bacterium]
MSRCSCLHTTIAAMGAIASVIDDDAARWINGASKDIMDVQNEVEDFLGQDSRGIGK